MYASLHERVEALERRLERFDDERGVTANMYRYAHAIDYGDEATWVDCFMPDGAFDMRQRDAFDRPGRRIEGREALMAFIKTHTRAPANWHKHVVVQPEIQLTGPGTARTKSYLFRLDESSAGEPYVLVFGRYFDRVRRCDDGLWRFEERIVEIESLKFR